MHGRRSGRYRYYQHTRLKHHLQEHPGYKLQSETGFGLARKYFYSNSSFEPSTKIPSLALSIVIARENPNAKTRPFYSRTDSSTTWNNHNAQEHIGSLQIEYKMNAYRQLVSDRTLMSRHPCRAAPLFGYTNSTRRRIFAEKLLYGQEGVSTHGYGEGFGLG